jgi:hypothetical protein
MFSTAWPANIFAAVAIDMFEICPLQPTRCNNLADRGKSDVNPQAR